MEEETRQDYSSLSTSTGSSSTLPPLVAPKRFEQCLLFFCGLGSSVAYIATLSSLVLFKAMFGPDSYVDLNLAVYLPLLPVSLLQAKFDTRFDVAYQSRRTFLFRGIIAFGLILWGTIGILISFSTQYHYTLNVLIGNAVLQGTGGAILYGTLNQLSSFLGPTDEECRKAKATISAGVQASALLVLLISLGSGFGTHNSTRFPAFIGLIVATELVCFLMFFSLLLKRPSIAASMFRRDSSLRLDTIETLTLVVSEAEDANLEESMVESNSLDQENPLQEPLLSVADARTESHSVLWKYSKSCCFILLLTLIPSFLVGSWFTHVNSEWMRLPQILFYVRIAADFLGRLTTICVPPSSLSCLTGLCLVRLVPVLFFFARNRESSNSIGSAATFEAAIFDIGLVSIIAFLSGYLVTGTFQLAPQCIPHDLRQSNNLTKQVSILTVAFSVAAILGLLSSFCLSAIGF